MPKLRPFLAILDLSLVLACSSSPSQPEDNNPQDNNPPPDPVVAHIQGPTLLGIPVGDDPSRTATFSGASSTGPIVRYEWFELNASEPFAQGVTAERTLSAFGYFLTRLRVEGADGQSDEDTLATRLDLDLKRGDPVLGFTTTNRYGTDSIVIAYMLPTGTEVSLGFKLPRLASGSFGGAAWNPGHTRLVFSYGDDIWVANRDGSQLKKIIDTEWVAWEPDWSPTGEWITYNDDSYGGVGPPDLLYVARPDGTQVTLVGGDSTDWNFSVGYPSWDPTGTQIAAIARWEVEPGVTKRRIVIFGNLWGTPTRRALHTEAQIEAVFGPPTEYEMYEGDNGLSWSSDGEWIAYVARAVPPDLADEYKLAVARTDGSGEIRILASGLEANALFKPTWSPDSQTVFFTRWVGDGRTHIFSIPATGGSETDLSARTEPDAYDSFPFF